MSAFQRATLVKVSTVLVFHIPVCRTSTYSVFQHSALPQVLSMCQMLPADLNYYEACSYTTSLRSTLFCYNHKVPLTTRCVSVVVSCSKCLLYVDYMFQGKVSWFFMLYQLCRHWCKSKSRPMRPLVLRREDLCGILASLLPV